MHIQLASNIGGGIDVDHAEHCFIYLRGAILCSGDTTLEPPDELKLRQNRNPLHGWGVQHVCTDRKPWQIGLRATQPSDRNDGMESRLLELATL